MWHLLNLKKYIVKNLNYHSFSKRRTLLKYYMIVTEITKGMKVPKRGVSLNVFPLMFVWQRPFFSLIQSFLHFFNIPPPLNLKCKSVRSWFYFSDQQFTLKIGFPPIAENSNIFCCTIIFCEGIFICLLNK